MSRTVGTAGGVLALVLAAGGCGVALQDTAEPVAAEVPSGPGSGSTGPVADGPGGTAGTASPGVQAVTAWFVRDRWLVPVPRTVVSPATPQRLLDAVEAGPTGAEVERGVRTLLTDPVDAGLLAAVASPASQAPALRPGVVSVVLEDTFRLLPARDQLLALGQLVLTLDPVTPEGVVFVGTNGSRVAVPLSNGVAQGRPVTPADFSGLVAPG